MGTEEKGQLESLQAKILQIERQYFGGKITLPNLELSIDDLSYQVEELQRKLEVQERLKELEYHEENPYLLLKFGDRAKGWIPGAGAYLSFIDQIQKLKLDKKYNILFHSYGIEVEKL